MRFFRAQYLLQLIVFFTVYGCARPVVDEMSVPKSASVIERGSYLVNGLAACGFCHGLKPEPFSYLAGGQTVTDIYGKVTASNITPSKSGIGDLKDDQIILAIRGSWPKELDRRSPDIHRGYEWMSSADVISVVSYLRTITAVKNQIPIRLVGFTARNTTGLFTKAPLVQGLVPDIQKNNSAQYGKYLVKHIARCDQCHSLDIAEKSKNKDAAPFVGQAASANRWSDENLVNFIVKGGIKPSGALANPALCPTKFFANSSKEDAQAIAAYIRTL